MPKYVCFTCGKEMSDDTARRKIRCPYCGGRMLYKRRATATKVKAR
jgi:DNA-directed RNA polymerase subunit RPC12/RpoP